MTRLLMEGRLIPLHRLSDAFSRISTIMHENFKLEGVMGSVIPNELYVYTLFTLQLIAA